MVRTIGQPPSAVPNVNETAHASFVHVGAARLLVLPSASSTTATTPTDFEASFAPWPNASVPDMNHWPARTAGRKRSVGAGE